jgi:hypothetical protein
MAAKFKSPLLAVADMALARPTMWYSERVLVEERGPLVAWRVIPADSGAPGERGVFAEIAEPDSR